MEDHEDSAEYVSPLLMRKKKNIDLRELRLKAMKYYQEKKVPEILEKLLNDMYFEQPNDIFSYLSNFFKKLAKPPTFHRIRGFEKFGSNGYRILGCKIYCMILDNPQVIAEASTSKEPLFYSDFTSITSNPLVIIDGPLNRILRNCDLRDVGRCDEELTKFVHDSESKLDMGILDDSETVSSESKLKVPQREKKITVSRLDHRKISMTPKSSPPRRLSGRHYSRDDGRLGMDLTVDEWWTELGRATLTKATYCASLALHRAAAFLTDVPLYRVIAQRTNPESNQKFQMPRIMVTIISKNKLNPGKINMLSEAGVILDLNKNFRMVLSALMKILHRTNELLQLRGSPTCGLMNSSGAAVESFDKLESPLEFLNELLLEVDVDTKKNISYYIQFSPPDEIRDNDKGKVEVTKGQPKSWEDMVDIYIDLFKSFPVTLVIDPLPNVAESAWEKLTEQASAMSVSVMKSNLRHTTDTSTTLDSFHTGIHCGSVLKPTSLSTVTKIIEYYKELASSSELPIALEACEIDVVDPFIVDLTIGMRVPFLKVGGLIKAENIGKINRLYDICEELEQRESDDSKYKKSISSDVVNNDEMSEINRIING